MARSLVLVSGAAMLSILAHSAAALAADCFVDSVGGSDSNNGTSEATAWASPSKVTSSCTTVKFKRGSQFNLAKGVKNLGITAINSVKTLTNYGDASQPLPKFVKEHVDGSGGMIQAYSAITIDGLYLAGSKSANSMGQLMDGIGVMLGAGSKLLNSEITLCDIGVMTSGDNVVVQGNYIHDLSISVDAPPGVDPNQVGGAEGVFVNSSHVDVSYNRFINCSTAAKWVTNTNAGGVRCDGGATEVTVPYAGEVTDVHIHHNFVHNSCGLFEVSSMPSSGTGAYVKGKFTNSEFHDNVVVDSGWISLLQINNTKLANVRWENNTIVHHFLPTIDGLDPDGKTVKIDMNDFASSYIQVMPFNSTSSGVTGGGVLDVGDVYWTNNLWYFDPAIKNFSGVDATHASTDQFVKNITITGDKVFRADPGFVDITSTTDPNAYSLIKGSLAIDQGVTNADVTADVTTDFADRPRPIGASFDLGAWEYQGDSAGGVTGSGGSIAVSTGGTSSAAGSKATGGGTAISAGGTASAVGGKSGGGTSSAVGGKSGGGTSSAAGGKAAGGSSSVVVGGASSSGGTPTLAIGGTGNSTISSQGGLATNVGGGAQSSGGQTATSSSSSDPTGGQVGSPGQGGNSASAPVGGAQGTNAGFGQEGGCACRMAGRSSNGRVVLGLLALGALLLGRSRRRRV